MPIVSHPVADITPRDDVLSDLGLMIDEAANSPEDINPFALAGKILDFIEERVNSVDPEGNVIYRT